MPDNLIIRDATLTDRDCLTTLWHDGWQDAHADILPSTLKRYRTVENFRDRIIESIENIRLATLHGRIIGFAMFKDDELYQFYLAAEARGSGAAAELMVDAFQTFRATGHLQAWLACAIGNTRAARFYQKTGWSLTETFTSELEFPDGIFPLDVWRYTIEL